MDSEFLEVLFGSRQPESILKNSDLRKDPPCQKNLRILKNTDPLSLAEIRSSIRFG